MFKARKETPMSTIHAKYAPEVPLATPQLTHQREHLIRASDHLWRVHSSDGGLRGHLRVLPDPLGLRYRAERLHRATGQFWIVGEFWTADDAVIALRN